MPIEQQRQIGTELDAKQILLPAAKDTNYYPVQILNDWNRYRYRA